MQANMLLHMQKPSNQIRVILHNFKIMAIIHSEPSGIHSISIEINLDSKTAVKITKMKIMIKVIYITHTAHADCMPVWHVFFTNNNYTQGRKVDHRNKYDL